VACMLRFAHNTNKASIFACGCEADKVEGLFLVLFFALASRIFALVGGGKNRALSTLPHSLHCRYLLFQKIKICYS